jgi:uncharacterized membrane protein YkvA (DUF1232 family)
MTDNELLDKFGSWVESLTDDAKAMRAAVEAEGVSREAKRNLIAGLSYLLRKIDIVPDYLGGLGSVDDAMVMRVSTKLALDAGLGTVDDETKSHLEKLSADVSVVEEFLGDLFDSFKDYTAGLPDTKVRGRSADTVLDDDDARQQFGYELDDELKSFEIRPVEGGDKALRELCSFIKAKVTKKE